MFGEPSSSLLTAPSHAAGASQAIKFEDDSDQMLSFFRTSPFRTTQYESATIDPHVVEHGSLAQPTSLQSTLAMPLDSISPSQLAAAQANPFNAAAESSLKHEHHNRDDSAAPMSEDGMSEDDDDDDEHDGEHRRSKSSGMGKTLSTIPMAVGDTNYLKPDPEEYKKLSSKEKRQLRNKISARNFRTRRKEYINQLEDQIADRDALIEGLRQQISQLSVENKSLKDEVRTIKARTISSQDVGKILEALQTMTSTANNPTAAAAGNGGALNVSGDVASGRSSPTNEFGGAPSGVLTPGAFLNFGSDASRPGTPTFACRARRVRSRRVRRCCAARRRRSCRRPTRRRTWRPRAASGAAWAA